MRALGLKKLGFLILASVIYSLFTPQAYAASSLSVGFDFGTGDITSDLTNMNGSAYLDYNGQLDASRIAEDAIHGFTAIHLLRYHASCPQGINNECTETIAQLQAFASANHGLTYSTGNEPGLGGQDNLDAGFYTWQKNVYNTIKAADPTAIVDGPSVFDWDSGSGWSGITHGKTIYSSGVLYDRVAVHLYPANYCGTMTKWVTQAKSQIDNTTAFANGVGKKVDITEVSDWYPRCSVNRTPTTAQRQSAVKAMKTEAVAKNVNMVLWFTNRDIGYGTGVLYNTGLNTFTPEGLAFKN